jgi:hypothetical protein
MSAVSVCNNTLAALQEAHNVCIDADVLNKANAAFAVRTKKAADALQEAISDGTLSDALHEIKVVQNLGLDDQVASAVSALQRRSTATQCKLLSAAQQCWAQMQCMANDMNDLETTHASIRSDRACFTPLNTTWMSKPHVDALQTLKGFLRSVLSSFERMQLRGSNSISDALQTIMAPISEMASSTGDLSSAVLDILMAAQEALRLHMFSIARAALEVVQLRICYCLARTQSAGICCTLELSYFGRVDNSHMPLGCGIVPSVDIIEQFCHSVIPRNQALGRPMYALSNSGKATVGSIQESMPGPVGSAMWTDDKASCISSSPLHLQRLDTCESHSLPNAPRSGPLSSNGIKDLADLPEDGLSACIGTLLMSVQFCACTFRRMLLSSLLINIGSHINDACELQLSTNAGSTRGRATRPSAGDSSWKQCKHLRLRFAPVQDVGTIHECCPSLASLSLQASRLPSLAGLEHMSQMQCLNVSDTGISSLWPSGSLTRLQVLAAEGNKLTSLTGMHG